MGLSEADFDVLEKGLDIKRRVIYLESEITMESAVITSKLIRLLAQKARKPITIVVNCMGGSVVGGLLIYDTLRTVAQHGCDIVTHAEGLCASMAIPILLAGDERSASENCQFLIHPLQICKSGPSQESLYQAQDDLANDFRIQVQVEKIITSRSGIKDVRALCNSKDYWFDTETAKKLGLI